MNQLNEFELSAPKHIWNKIIYDNNNIELDIYYNENGHPIELHDKFGANEVNNFRKILIDEIRKRNNCSDVARVASDAFAITYNEKNCKSFEIIYKEIKFTILKKHIVLTVF